MKNETHDTGNKKTQRHLEYSQEMSTKILHESLNPDKEDEQLTQGNAGSVLALRIVGKHNLQTNSCDMQQEKVRT